MTPFDTTAQRSDPYRHFKFRVKWDGREVAGFAKLSALQRMTEVVAHREGGELQSRHKAPGRTEFDAITLERGITHDTGFEQWAREVYVLDGSLVGARPRRKRQRTRD